MPSNKMNSVICQEYDQFTIYNVLMYLYMVYYKYKSEANSHVIWFQINVYEVKFWKHKDFNHKSVSNYSLYNIQIKVRAVESVLSVCLLPRAMASWGIIRFEVGHYHCVIMASSQTMSLPLAREVKCSLGMLLLHFSIVHHTVTNMYWQ